MIKAYAAHEAGGEFKPYEYDPGELTEHEVEIEVAHCGVCHSDYSMWKNAWGMSSFPFVGGHEVAGFVARKGRLVDHLQVGDRVGLGWHKGYCLSCQESLRGDHNLAPDIDMTIVGNQGGFADKVRAQDTSVIKLPDGMDLAAAAPLMCAGVTVFNPLLQLDIKPTDHVAVLGIGGLGHLALKFARAWGCEVTAFTSESKMDEALSLGAHNCVNSRDKSAVAAASNRFDLIISTVDVALDWNLILTTLKPKGRLHLVGAVKEPLGVDVFPMLLGQKSISGSPVGSPSTLNLMMEFAVRHNIKPVTEHFKFDQINDAFARLESGQARYRIVLDRE